MKLVSIIIPYFNSESFFSQTLQSIAVQAYDNIEVIIVDDGSNDTSKEALKSIINKSSLKNKIKLLTNATNQGPSFSRNVGITSSSGQYILLLDSDDMLLGRFSLESRVDYLEAHPSYVGVGGYIQHIDESTQYFISPTYPHSIESYRRARHNPDELLNLYCRYALSNPVGTIHVLFFVAGSSLFRNEVFADCLFDSRFDKEEDVEWTLRFLQHGGKFALLKNVFVLKRKHEEAYHLTTPTALTSNVKKMMEEIITNSQRV